MTKIMRKLWNKNEGHLRNAVNNLRDDDVTYLKLVEYVFGYIYNFDEEVRDKFNLQEITEIDNGDYQGTLLYLIPEETYQPLEHEYVMTYIGYGSCSGCDALQGALCLYDDKSVRNNDLMEICKDIATNTIRPYNHGWRRREEWDSVEADDQGDAARAE